jgi:hypothetical protein
MKTHELPKKGISAADWNTDRTLLKQVVLDIPNAGAATPLISEKPHKPWYMHLSSLSKWVCKICKITKIK